MIMNKLVYRINILPLFAVLLFGACRQVNKKDHVDATLLRNVTLIDGNGKTPQEGVDILIQGDTIAAIGKGLDTTKTKAIDLTGKTIIPALICTHAHLGTLKGTRTTADNYTRENILRQLKRYQDYGVLHVQCMGTDRPLLFENQLYDSLRNGLLPGARMFSAGYGFNTPSTAPLSPNFWMDRLFRPVNIEAVRAEMDTLANLPTDIVKMWVDDFGGTAPKMAPEIYTAIIQEAHKSGKRVASHLYNQEDARNLVNAGLDIIAHSIRDQVIDDELVKLIKDKGVFYIPTLSLDEFAFVYAKQPEWINDPFFKAALEPGVLEMITSESYQRELRESPAYRRNKKGFEIALKNLKKLHDAGVIIAMGTDSGAFPIRAQGFSEHEELTLMVQAGLSPLQAITAATKNAAELLKIDRGYGTLIPGKVADLMVLGANPAENIKNTRKIEAVYKAGKLVSRGPF